MDELKITEKTIFRTIHKMGTMSKKELVQKLGSSVTNVSRFLSAMEEAGLVEREDEERRPGGRRPDIYRIRPDAAFAFGGFISGEGFGIGLCDAVGTVLRYRAEPFNASIEPTDVAAYFDSAIQEILKVTDVDRKKILGVGLGVVGPIRKHKGLMFHSYHMDSALWEVVPIRDIVEMKTGFPTVIDSMAETVLMNEIVYGHAKKAESAAFIWMDRGIGCAIYSKGVLGIGNADFSSSVGHLVIDFKGEPCQCGKRGCLETYGSMENLVRRLGSAYGASGTAVPSLNGQTGSIDFWHKFAPFEQIEKDLKANRIPNEVVEEISDAFVVGITNFLSITRPNTIIYGGRTMENLPTLMNAIVRKIAVLQRDEGAGNIQSLSCRLDHDLIIRGGALLCMNPHIGFVNTNVRQEGRSS